MFFKGKTKRGEKIEGKIEGKLLIDFRISFIFYHFLYEKTLKAVTFLKEIFNSYPNFIHFLLPILDGDRSFAINQLLWITL